MKMKPQTSARLILALGAAAIAGTILYAQSFRISTCIQVSAPTAATTGGRVCSGTGSPEGAVVGWKGDVFLRRDGGSGTMQYNKESGAGTNTGWVAVGTGVGAHNLLSASHTDTTTASGTKGDLIVSDGSTWKRLAAGTNAYVLTANSAVANGIEWAVASGGGGGGGSVDSMASNIVTTGESTSSTSYVDLTTTGPSVTMTTGSTATIFFSANVSKTSGNVAFISVDVSGATTVAAADGNSAYQSMFSCTGTCFASMGRVLRLTGLTPGSNTFKLKYRGDGGTWTFEKRTLAVSTDVGGGNIVGAAVNTDESQAASAAYGDLATVGPAITLTTGTMVVLDLYAKARRPGGGAGFTGWISVAVSGATTMAATDAMIDSCAFGGCGVGSAEQMLGRVNLQITGLTPGSNTFTMKYHNDGGGTWNFRSRSIRGYVP